MDHKDSHNFVYSSEHQQQLAELVFPRHEDQAELMRVPYFDQGFVLRYRVMTKAQYDEWMARVAEDEALSEPSQSSIE